MKTLAVILAAAALAGCDTMPQGQTYNGPAVIPQYRPIQIQPYMMQVPQQRGFVCQRIGANTYCN